MFLVLASPADRRRADHPAAEALWGARRDARVHDAQDGMPAHVLQREIDPVGGRIDRDGVRVWAEEAAAHLRDRAIGGNAEHGDHAGLRGRVEALKTWIEGEHV